MGGALVVLNVKAILSPSIAMLLSQSSVCVVVLLAMDLICVAEGLVV